MDVFLFKTKETIDPRGMAKFNPRDMIGIIYNGDYQTLLHTKYRSSGPSGSEKKIFLVFPIVSLWRLSPPLGVAKYDPRSMAGTTYVEDP